MIEKQTVFFYVFIHLKKKEGRDFTCIFSISNLQKERQDFGSKPKPLNL